MKSKRIIWLSLLLTALMLVSQASATLYKDALLPASTLYDGYTYYGEEIDNGNGTSSYMQGRIDFAVYDKTAGNEWATITGYDNPGNGRYIYAYQIFNDYQGYSEVPIQAFSIFGLDGADISVIAGSVGTEEDPLGGQDASDTALSDTTVTWNFANGTTDDYTIGIDEHSFFLIFSSNYGWAKGDYSLEPYSPDFPVAPGGDASATGDVVLVPEPITVALLGLGSLVAFVKRKR